ncbi:hypothetical protein [Brevibacillus borstelensis]|uniref:hypothetical protein n=1 Tax=Brevibacillus borstelensis TaxID=45462 RepID=UPI002E1B3B97|nr:hypothetical protein [Brevibacillus borstelensis]
MIQEKWHWRGHPHRLQEFHQLEFICRHMGILCNVCRTVPAHNHFSPFAVKLLDFKRRHLR